MLVSSASVLVAFGNNVADIFGVLPNGDCFTQPPIVVPGCTVDGTLVQTFLMKIDVGMAILDAVSDPRTFLLGCQQGHFVVADLFGVISAPGFTIPPVSTRATACYDGVLQTSAPMAPVAPTEVPTMTPGAATTAPAATSAPTGVIPSAPIAVVGT